MWKHKHFAPLVAVVLFLMSVVACTPPAEQQKPRLVMFVGVDISGSFLKTGLYDDAMTFLANYIYGHLNGLGELEKLRELFVASIGGQAPGEPKAFYPIHDFEGKDVVQIDEMLRSWFSPKDTITDFNAFFKEVARTTKDRNLSLAPLCTLIVTDGIPALETSEGKDVYKLIDLDPLEYLSRRVTVRLLYLDPKVAQHWHDDVPARRVRIWTVAAEVMGGWKNQMEPGKEPARQQKLWKWIKDNVDFRVRARRF
jgi:hypothetical protein